MNVVTADAPHLVVRQVAKHYGAATVLDGIDLTIARGELVTLLGPSGCGKTTLLRIVAGLVDPDGGSVELAGRDVTKVPPHKRRVGVVFQNYALFPHLTVAGNVAFGLKLQGLAKDVITDKVTRALDLVHLGHLGDRPIAALSGGQQQRVALARAMAVEPEVMLFDEALSALDRKLRDDMQIELRRLLTDIGATAIFVTHDQDEALTMSDRIAVMNRGRIEQLADPVTVYSRPTTLFTLGFVGLSIQLRGVVTANNGDTVDVDTQAGAVTATGNFIIGSPVVVGVRPENVRPGDGGGNKVTGQVRSTTFHGSRMRIDTDVRGALVMAELSSLNIAMPGAGETITLSWPVAETFAYPAPEAVI